LREDLILGRPGPQRQSAELAIGVVFRVLQAFMGRQWRPLRVCFSHDAPADRTEHDRLFGCRVEFGQAFNGIVCSSRDLEVANPDADPGLARMARQLLDANPSEAADNLTAQVRRLVVGLLGQGGCRVDIVAQHLGVDRRTIHRRLAAEGETFSHVVTSVRRELATVFLKDPNRDLADVSALLGFSSLSGFSRWHRQQFGETASAQRPTARRTAAARHVRARTKPP
jgi:AraC-like DNA-binding protein